MRELIRVSATKSSLTVRNPAALPERNSGVAVSGGPFGRVILSPDE